MATPEHLVPSRRLQTAAAAERERLSRELARLDTRAAELQHELDQLDAKRSALRDQLSLLARFANTEDSAFPTATSAGRATHLQAVREGEPAPKAVLRGSRIREVAVLLLASSPNPRRPIHYQQWYELLRQAGYGIEAQNPLRDLSYQVARSPVVRRAGTGIYALDFGAPGVLRERLRRLEDELARSSVAGGSAEQLAEAREQRTKLLTDARATDRQLEEALRSLLGDNPS